MELDQRITQALAEPIGSADAAKVLADTLAKPTNGRDRNGQFAKGSSGNPEGCATGSRHKVSRAVEALIEGESERLTKQVIRMALGGDGQALRLCLERLCPPIKERVVSFSMPEVIGLADHPAAISRILAGVARGEITPGEATALGKLLDGHASAISMAVLAERVAQLEEGA